MSKVRHMKQARRVDNGELVQGYCLPFGVTDILDGMRVRNQKGGWHTVKVDPATVEDLAVKPIWDYCWRCPKCKSAYTWKQVCYCPDCGQRIDWSGEYGE